MHKTAVFLNPKASCHQKADWQRAIGHALFRSDLHYVTVGDNADFTASLDALAKDSFDAVIAVGGDGTAHTLIQKAVGTNTRFLILPGGTANDLSCEVGHNFALNHALDLVRADSWKAIDLIAVNDVLMATNGGIGLIAEVSAAVQQHRQEGRIFASAMSLLGRHVYSGLLGLKLLRGDIKYYTVDIVSKEFSGRVTTPLLLVNNQSVLGGTFPVAPHTHNNDGRFNVTVFTHSNLAHLSLSIDRVRRHSDPALDPEVVTFETDELSIKSAASETLLSFHGDGEAMVQALELKIKVKPSALKVLIPNGHKQVRHD